MMNRIKFGSCHSHLFEFLIGSTKNFTYRSVVLKLLGLSKTPTWSRISPAQSVHIYHKKSFVHKNLNSSIPFENEFISDPLLETSVNKGYHYEERFDTHHKPDGAQLFDIKKSAITNVTSGLEKMLISEMQQKSFISNIEQGTHYKKVKNRTIPDLTVELSDTQNSDLSFDSFSNNVPFNQNILPVNHKQHLQDAKSLKYPLQEKRSSEFIEVTSAFANKVVSKMQQDTAASPEKIENRIFHTPVDDFLYSKTRKLSLILNNERTCDKPSITQGDFNNALFTNNMPLNQYRKVWVKSASGKLNPKSQANSISVLQNVIFYGQGEEPGISGHSLSTTDNTEPESSTESNKWLSEQNNFIIQKDNPVPLIYKSEKMIDRCSDSPIIDAEKLHKKTNNRTEKFVKTQKPNIKVCNRRVVPVYNGNQKSSFEFLERNYLFQAIRRIVR